MLHTGNNMKMTLLPFLFVSFINLLQQTSGALTPLRHEDGALMQIESFLDSSSDKVDDQYLVRLALRHPRGVRLMLQQPEEECGSDFVPNSEVYLATVLGPAGESDSLFQNVKLPNNETLDLYLFAYFLLYPLYIYP